ncbi:SOS response-associated peptidase [Arthrobacter ramosus]|uniref:SOS response-associated peptidase n=1 Tax=Arthrobacter ramosus TaxID=1672 RepID=UPI001F1A2DB9|nr:SOS response-associated peptidase [Arthrobacter ramosus]
MCGRYVMSRATGDLLAYYDATEAAGSAPGPSWNVAPTQNVPIVAEKLSEDVLERRLLTARWGLVPSWAKDVKLGSSLINARSETILEKPSFRKAAVKRRALVPAEGWFEWEKSPDGKKIPTYLHSETEDMLSLAGLYEFWPDTSLPEDDENKWLLSCTILTTTAQDSLGHIHDRAPLIVPRDLHADWLDPMTTSAADVQQLLAAIPEPVITPRIVSDRVNSVRNNGPELVEPA